MFMARQAQQQQQEVTEEAGGNGVCFHSQQETNEEASGNGVRSHVTTIINGTVQRCAPCLTVDCINYACIF